MPFLKVGAASRALPVHPNTLRTWANRGKINTFGRLQEIRQSSVSKTWWTRCTRKLLVTCVADLTRFSYPRSRRRKWLTGKQSVRGQFDQKQQDRWCHGLISSLKNSSSPRQSWWARKLCMSLRNIPHSVAADVGCSIKLAAAQSTCVNHAASQWTVISMVRETFFWNTLYDELPPLWFASTTNVSNLVRIHECCWRCCFSTCYIL